MVVSVKRNVKIVVLGDIGHSPRISNHAMSLANRGHFVDIIGYGETKPREGLRDRPNVSFHYLWPCPKIGIKFLNYIWKTIWTTINLLFLMFMTRKSDSVLVQNPPSIPSLYVCWFYCRVIKAKFVIDWHNYGYTIMALSLGENSLLVAITRKIEGIFGRRADQNFCVSKAMKEDLMSKWEISAEVLYDRPCTTFHELNSSEKHAFIYGASQYRGFEVFINKDFPESSVFSHKLENGQIEWKKDRPGFIVTSTSWTEDENFNLLIYALQEYEDHCKNGNKRKLPKLILAITGRGPLEKFYLQEIISRKWENIVLFAGWLPYGSYRNFIACADIGICLHTSSSGLDLPMKIIDLFGACVPVFAYNFKALNELVSHGKNSFVFNNEKGLARLLQEWFDHFPNNKSINEANSNLRRRLRGYADKRWEWHWNKRAAPTFDD